MCIELYCRLIGESISNMPGNRKKIVATGRLRSLLVVLALAIFMLPSGLVYALEETFPHSIFKHDLIESIVYHENVDTVFDLYGGAIVYEKQLRNGRTIREIGAAGRIIMNGYAKDYYINDMSYQNNQKKCSINSNEKKEVAVYVTNNKIVAMEQHLEKIGAESYLAIIDPYRIEYRDVNNLQKAVQGDQNKKLLIFSKFDISRFTNNYPHCYSVVYSDPDRTKSTEYNEYTLIGCNINSWRKAINTTLKAMKNYKIVRSSVDSNSNEIQLGNFFPPKYDQKYMTTAQSVQSCVGFIPPAQ